MRIIPFAFTQQMAEILLRISPRISLHLRSRIETYISLSLPFLIPRLISKSVNLKRRLEGHCLYRQQINCNIRPAWENQCRYEIMRKMRGKLSIPGIFLLEYY